MGELMVPETDHHVCSAAHPGINGVCARRRQKAESCGFAGTLLMVLDASRRVAVRRFLQEVLARTFRDNDHCIASPFEP